MPRRAILLFLLLTLLPACTRRPKPATTPGPPPAPAAKRVPAPVLHSVAALRAEVDAFLDGPSFERAIWGVVVQSMDSAEFLYRRNPATLLMPASNMKIVTLAACAERLGWDFTFETRLVAEGPIEGGVLRGDLIVVGGGDPTFNRRHGDPAATFAAWAGKLHEEGISRIDGRIVGDDRLFQRQLLGAGWAWDYLAAGYAAPIGALQLNEDTVELLIRPGAAAGDPAPVSIRQAEAGLTVDNRASTGAAGTEARLDMDRLPGSNLIRLTGSVPAGGNEVTRTVSVDNPAEYFARMLRAALVGAGITVTGEGVDVASLPVPPDPARGQVLVSHRSVPLAEIAKVLMKVSQNLYAETLLRMAAVQTPPTSVDAGQKVVRAVLEEWGIPADSFVLADGSGLSRYNYLNADLLVSILRRLYRDPRHRENFLETLPVAGVDGTLSRRLRETRAASNVRAKTGSIANARALSGYVRTLDGEMLAFSILANNFNVPSQTVEATTDLIVERLANFTRK